MDSITNEFIEIRRVWADQYSGNNVSSEPETIRVSLIETFREWRKGKKDEKIEGKMTVLILNNKKPTDDPNKKTIRTMLIAEDYDSFLYRMSLKTGVKRLPDELSGHIQGKQSTEEVHIPTSERV